MQKVLSELKAEIKKAVIRGFIYIDLKSSFRMIKTIENELEKVFKVKIKD